MADEESRSKHPALIYTLSLSTGHTSRPEVFKLAFHSSKFRGLMNGIIELRSL
ncbi:hypothetical protein M7I_4010 [Glarea lozoyensis 74030]|uniref:Uncharacterized protein n=1 Tax=Glarea lozoyensis (strain ATCC 74030 / MF5533) TaxID=1104152 RepID=H0EN11_GLAL7|nr:hypothetical protein M7I_4010 [Glarea lozoyensis 74030]